jgi:mxaJ protein
MYSGSETMKRDANGATRRFELTAWQERTALLLPLLALFAVAYPSRVREAFAHLSTNSRPAPASHLRVCADPNNLPFSNTAREGFENHIAELIGRELHEPVEYVWWAQRRGFVRNTLNSGACDLVVGIASGVEMLATTRPYYKSTYVFVSRHDRRLGITSFNDPALERLKIGVQLIGDDFANTPPAHALSNRGMTKNVIGYTVYGDYRQPNPAARIIDGVVTRQVDIAVVWGPLAGYFAKESPVPLDIVPVSPRVDLPYLPFVFDIAMGVRRGDTTFRARIDDIITRKRPAIDSILRQYAVPRVDVASVATGPES